MRLCLYNQEKPTESINHNNPNLGALCALNNSSVYITLSSYLHSLAYVVYASPALMSPPAPTGFLASAIPCSLQISSGGGVSRGILYVFPGKWVGLLQYLRYFFPPFCHPIGVLMSCVLTSPKQQLHVLWFLQTQRHFLFCSQENASSPLPVFSQGFLNHTICVPVPSRFFFFSKQLRGRETKLKGKYYALLTTQASAAMTKAL